MKAKWMLLLLSGILVFGCEKKAVAPKFTLRSKQARITAANTDIATFGVALDTFEIDRIKRLGRTSLKLRWLEWSLHQKRNSG